MIVLYTDVRAGELEVMCSTVNYSEGYPIASICGVPYPFVDATLFGLA